MRARVLAVGMLTAVAVVTAGCQDSGSPSDPGAHSNIVDELSAQVDRSQDRTFHAEYHVGDDVIVTMARSHELEATMYQFPEGSYVVTSDTVMVCAGEGDDAECSADPADEAPEIPPAHVMEQFGATGFVTARAAVTALTEASAMPDTTHESSSTTVVGEHATCLSVTGGSSGDVQACVTDGGVLASFEGEIDGDELYLSLKSYSGNVDDEWFEIPDDVEADASS